MEYTAERLSNIQDEEGEFMIVLESGVEYDVHGDTRFNENNQTVELSGLRGTGDGVEFRDVTVPVETIEHHYTHREV